MYQGTLPILTKGPLALFYGGQHIIGDLSEKSPGRGVPIMLMCSAIFQICLYILKQSKSRKLKMYAHNLTKALVENVLNVYGIISIIIITIVSVAYVILHHRRIEKNNTEEIVNKLVPREIVYLYIVIFLITVVPFTRSYALR